MSLRRLERWPRLGFHEPRRRASQHASRCSGIAEHGEGRVHWSANFDEIQDFERDIRESFDGSGFMSDAEFDARKGANGDLDTFGKPAAGVEPRARRARSVYHILRHGLAKPVPQRQTAASPKTLVRGARSSSDQAARSAIRVPTSPTAPRSERRAARCRHHPANIGMRLGGTLTGIDTPTLKGVWQTAPYLHDGRAATLVDIFTKYTKDNMGRTSDLTDAELGQLARYLQELDDVPETPVADEEVAIAGGGFSCSMKPATRRESLGLAGLVVLAGVAIVRRRRHLA